MPLIRRIGRRTRAGATVLEISVSTFVFGAVLVGAGQAMSRVGSVWASSTAQNESERQGGRAMQDIRRALSNISAETIATDLSAPEGASSITFRRMVGWESGKPVLGNVTTLAWELDPAEKENGVDDDKDGLVDEGCVVITQEFGGAAHRTVLVSDVPSLLEGETANQADDNCNGLVDERGFVLSKDPTGGLCVRLTVLRRAGPKKLVWKTMDTSVAVRN